MVSLNVTEVLNGIMIINIGTLCVFSALLLSLRLVFAHPELQFPLKSDSKLKGLEPSFKTETFKDNFKVLHYSGLEAYMTVDDTPAAPDGSIRNHFVHPGGGRGLHYSYLLALREKFNCTMVMDIFSEAEVQFLKNTSVNGLAEPLRKGQYDIGIPFTQVMSREKFATFSTGIIYERLVFTTTVKVGHSSLVVLKPYEATVWYCFLGWWCLVFAGLTMKKIWTASNWIQVLDVLTSNVFLVLRLLLLVNLEDGHGRRRSKRSSTSRHGMPRVVAILALLVGMISAILYTTKLIAFLANPPLANPKTFEELEKAAEASEYQVYMREIGNPQQVALKKMFPGIFRKFRQVDADKQCILKVIEDPKAACVETDYVISLLLRANFKGIGLDKHFEGSDKKATFFKNINEAMQNHISRAVGAYFSKNITIIGEEFVKQTIVFFQMGLPEAWIEEHLISLRRESLLERKNKIKLMDKRLDNEKEPKNLEDNGVVYLKLKHLYKFLFICATLMGLASFVFGAEVAVGRWSKRRALSLIVPLINVVEVVN